MTRYAMLAALMLFGTSSHAADDAAGPLTGTMTSLDGGTIDLDSYKGKVVLVINVASRCGNTPQYAGLQELHERYADKGLAVLGFPCNQFGGQEPGTEADIKAFCEKNYGVEFPMFSKIDVNGEAAAPLYRYLTSDQLPVDDKGDIGWNFEKFLFDRDGKVVARFRSKVQPTSPELIEAIESALQAGG